MSCSHPVSISSPRVPCFDELTFLEVIADAQTALSEEMQKMQESFEKMQKEAERLHHLLATGEIELTKRLATQKSHLEERALLLQAKEDCLRTKVKEETQRRATQLAEMLPKEREEFLLKSHYFGETPLIMAEDALEACCPRGTLKSLEMLTAIAKFACCESLFLLRRALTERSTEKIAHFQQLMKKRIPQWIKWGIPERLIGPLTPCISQRASLAPIQALALLSPCSLDHEIAQCMSAFQEKMPTIVAEITELTGKNKALQDRVFENEEALEEQILNHHRKMSEIVFKTTPFWKSALQELPELVLKIKNVAYKIPSLVLTWHHNLSEDSSLAVQERLLKEIQIKTEEVLKDWKDELSTALEKEKFYSQERYWAANTIDEDEEIFDRLRKLWTLFSKTLQHITSCLEQQQRGGDETECRYRDFDAPCIWIWSRY